MRLSKGYMIHDNDTHMATIILLSNVKHEAIRAIHMKNFPPDLYMGNVNTAKRPGHNNIVDMTTCKMAYAC